MKKGKHISQKIRKLRFEKSGKVMKNVFFCRHGVPGGVDGGAGARSHGPGRRQGGHHHLLIGNIFHTHNCEFLIIQKYGGLKEFYENSINHHHSLSLTKKSVE